MAYLFDTGIFSASDATGAALAGAKLEFFTAGTSSHQDTFTSIDLDPLAKNTNPVVADANGRWGPIWFNDQYYKYVLKDANDVVLVTRDNVGYSYPLSQLTSDRDYYVRTDGSDSQSGLANTSDAAFLTIQKAIDTAYGLDLNGYSVTIHVADGTYGDAIKLTGTLTGAQDSAGLPLQIIGNTGSLGNVQIDVSGDDAFTLRNGARLFLSGVTITAGGRGVYLDSYAILEASDVVWSNCNHEMILAAHYSTFRATGDLYFLGDAESWVHATTQSLVDMSSVSLTFAANDFSVYAIGLNASVMKLDSATGLGTKISTGDVLIHQGAALNVSSYTGVPWWGDSAPVIARGGSIQNSAYEGRTFYVRPGGTAFGTGLINSDAYAFDNIQRAINAISALPFDPAYWTNTSDLSTGWTINVAAGTYSGTVTLKDVHALAVTILGDETTPANVVIAGADDAITGFGVNTKYFVRGVTLTASNGSGLRANDGTEIIFRKVAFGACSFAHLTETNGGRITADGDYSITGDALYHFFLRGTGSIDISDRTATLSGTRAFTTFAYAESCSVLRTVSSTFTGSATGKRYDVQKNAVIDTNGGGASFIPGNSSGSSATGGQYV